jgi:putative ABC transport system ATP-binding protein
VAVAVRCKGLTKTYHTEAAEVTALRGIDLQVNSGELVMLVGPSGCGKTTLISVIAGILSHDSGVCEVFDHDLSAMSDNQRTEFRGKNLGFVFQSYNLIPTLTATENVAVPLLINGSDFDSALGLARQALEHVELGDKLDSLPNHLSGGQQQRVAIARALAHQPRLIVCDEPTSALDHDTGAKVMELFRKVAVDSGRALVVVTHDVRILRFADKIAKMDDGLIERIVTSEKELHA